MTLKGEARTKYMRDYMRKRRAGLPTAKSEKPAPMSKDMEKLQAKLAKCEAKLAAAKADIKMLRQHLNRSYSPAWGKRSVIPAVAIRE